MLCIVWSSVHENRTEKTCIKEGIKVLQGARQSLMEYCRVYPNSLVVLTA